jgi:hypothetical protein
MLVAGLAYNGHQDVHKLLGINRTLRFHEQLVLNLLVLEHAEAAITPRDMLNVLTGQSRPARDADD